MADSIRRAVAGDPFHCEAGVFRITVSIGIAQLAPEVHGSLDALISDADTALYSAKHAGRNRVVVYEPDELPTAR